MESDAEFAYRSVYERSLEAEKARKQAQKEQSRSARNTTDTVIHDLPPRRPERLGEAQEPEPAMEEAAAVRQALEPEQAETSAEMAEKPDVAAEGASPREERSVPQEERPSRIAGKPGPAYDALVPNPWFVPVFGQPVDPKDVLTTQVLGEEPARQAPVSQQSPRTRGEQYCTNIADEAADARFRWQQESLLQTEQELQKRIDQLQQQIVEYKKWMARRDEFSERAKQAVTDIYAKMRPEAAAQQLTALDELTAAAVIAKLNPRIASAVMAEMPAPQAARLTAIIAASARGPKGKAVAGSQQEQGT